MLDFSDEDTGLVFRAKMTNSQIQAVACFFEESRLWPSLEKSLSETFKFKMTPNFRNENSIRYFQNSWNTEKLLRKLNELDDDVKSFAIQWAFPQAYYSCFLSTLAFFKAFGCEDSSHLGVQRKLGELISKNRYPKNISWFADGGKTSITVKGVSYTKQKSTTHFDVQSRESQETQVFSFLKATREKQLNDRKERHKKEFKTKCGKQKNRLTKQEWEKISNRIGKTSILSLLYRKRLKANYEDIETFLSSELDSNQIIKDLINIVGGYNAIHETYVARTIGKNRFQKMLQMISDDQNKPNCRIDRILSLF